MTFQDGVSGNPAGRPPGRPDRRTRFREMFEDAAEDVVAKAIELAKGGDVYCMKLVIERVSPRLRDASERRPIAIDGETVEAAGRSVLALAAAGELSSDEAATLLTGLGRQAIAEQVGMIADVVARLASKAGVALPPELEVRARTPVTINQRPSSD